MRHNAGHSNTSPNYYCASNLHNKRPEVPVELVYVALLGLSSSSPQLGAQCCFVYLFYFMTFDTEIRLPEQISSGIPSSENLAIIPNASIFTSNTISICLLKT